MAARIAKARRSTDRLAHLVEALLDVSRIATGKLTLRRERLDLVGLAIEVADRMRDQAEQAGCKLSVSAPGELCGTWDRLRLEEVVAHILSNAFKYGAGTRVHVEVRREGPDAVLEISDQGPGIAPQDQQRVFGRFERAASRNYGGLGMGLYVSREIVRAHGGHIEASATPGGGATITARLPISPTSP